MILELLGMFGLSKINHSLNKHAGKSNANQYGMYKDGNGQYRLIQNGHWVVETYNDYGERIIKNVKNGITEINIDEIECRKREQEAIDNGNNYYLYRYERYDKIPKYRIGNQKIIGDRYKKIGQSYGVYVKRRIEIKNGYDFYSGEFYMDMNGEICEPTEETIKKDMEKYPDNYEQIEYNVINETNEFSKKEAKYSSKPPFYNERYIMLNDAINYEFKIANSKLSHWK